ncbi:YcgL domain-containing protein [Ferrimonas balearica]|uniref:YcgL domain-containing protein n=1 Tax=Ferrimonas balearica TaxID=44012 RepID=UPI001C99AA3B|nr:YcgL domain-containing protein [Ferrimonas balearica]MBY5920588.1 YcgL domain-containing protein [Ferrimonas balearica]MBY5996727.1 YcgL domain-containing protein [Ferrimonas balearica]
MICAIYKSSRKADTYLYLPKRDDFSKVPQPLMEVFGTPQFVMILPMVKIKQLANADLSKVTQELSDKGYYLQLPPPTEDLLKAHRRTLGLQD